MKIKSENYSKNINFYSRNKNVRKADDIQRRARNTFPVLSPSYIDAFYSSTSTIEDTPLTIKGREILKKIGKKLVLLRNVAHAPFKYGMEQTSLQKKTPYAMKLNNMKVLKVGNCDECAETVLAALAANGFYNSYKAYLGLEVQYIDKKTGETKYNELTPIDHSFVVTTLDQKDPKEKDKIIIDSWLGFADSMSGATDRFKKMLKPDVFEKAYSIHRSLFILNMYEETGKLIDFNDYELRSKLVFYRAENYTEEDMKNLGLYSNLIYDDLIVPVDFR